MRHQISLGFVALAWLALAGCDQHAVVEQPRQLAQYPVANAGLAPDAPGSGAIESHVITPPMSDGAVSGKTVRVGLLLPLTGRSAELGRAMQDAATLSLFDKYASLSSRQAGVKVELLPKDTGDTPEQAVTAMNEALAEGAEFVIGPIFADATEAAAPAAREKSVSVLSLSNAAKGGEGVYLFGFSPQEQTKRVVDYAMGAGKTRIAALVPDSPLGTTVLASARTTLAAHGFVLVKEVKYSPQGVGIDAAANELVGTGAAPEFDALLLPEGGASLGTILRALSARGVDGRNVKFLGTGIWDDAALIRRVPLEGAWLASSSPMDTMAFETRFRTTYQYLPPRVASLSYDAVALAVTLASSGRTFTTPTLTSPAGFSGPANGVFRLRKDGKVERGLAVLEVQSGAFKILSPSPAGFTQ